MTCIVFCYVAVKAHREIIEWDEEGNNVLSRKYGTDYALKQATAISDLLYQKGNNILNVTGIAPIIIDSEFSMGTGAYTKHYDHHDTMPDLQELGAKIVKLAPDIVTLDLEAYGLEERKHFNINTRVE